MAVADVTKKNLEENKEQGAAIDSLVVSSESGQNENKAQTSSLGSLVPTTEVVQENTDQTASTLGKIFDIQEDEIRRQKEKDKEDARNKDKGGGDNIEKESKKKGGLLGALFKGISGFFKGMFKVLIRFFKVLKWIAGGALLLGALAFFALPASGQQALIDGVIGFFKKIGEVLVSLGKAFGGGFMKNLEDDPESGAEGLITKFSKFKEAWGKALEKIGKIVFSIGGTTYKGLEGFAELFGDMIGKVTGFFLDIFTGIADLINDPTVMLAKMQVAIEDAFQSMGNVISNFFGKIFNKEGMLKMMQGMLGKDSLMFKGMEKVFGTVEDAALEREKDMMDERDSLKDKNAQMKKNVIRTQKLLEEEMGKGEDRDNARVSTLQKALSRETAAMDRNESQTKRLQENIDESRENIVEERVLKDLGEVAREQEKLNADRKEEIIDLKEEGSNLEVKEIGADISGMGMMAGSVEFDTKTFKNMLSLLQKDKSLGMQGVTAEQLASGETKLTEKAINALVTELGGQAGAREGLTKLDDQKIIFQAGLDRMAEIEKNRLQIKTEEAKLAETDSILTAKRLELETKHKAELAIERGDRHQGGPIKAGGIYRLLPNEMVLDNQAVQGLEMAIAATTGMNLMNLQRASGTIQGGSAPIVISNAPSTQINQSQALVLPPSPIQPGNSDTPRLLN